MGLTNFPNGITSFGLPVIGSGSDLPVTTGTYFFVNSSTGSSGNDGRSPESAVATITQALNLCTAAKGDVIVVAPGYTQTVSSAAGLTFTKSGVTLVGLGNGNARPTITMDTAATATITVTAANVTIRNIIVTANYADIATAFVVSGKDCLLERVSFRETAVDMNFLNCIRTGAVANGADGLSVVGCERISIDAAAIAFISILEACDRLNITDNVDFQAGATDVGHFIIMGAFVCLHAKILRNALIMSGDNNAQTVGVFMTGSSTTSYGIVAHNLVSQLDATTELFDTATLDFGHFENRMTGTIAKSGYVLPAIDA